MKSSDTKVLPDEIQKYVSEGYKLIDIREKAEMEDAPMIQGAINIPFSALLADPRQYFTDTNEKILLICRTGRRTKQLKKKLDNLGYTEIKDVAGGMTAYEKEQNK